MAGGASVGGHLQSVSLAWLSAERNIFCETQNTVHHGGWENTIKWTEDTIPLPTLRNINCFACCALLVMNHVLVRHDWCKLEEDKDQWEPPWCENTHYKHTRTHTWRARMHTHTHARTHAHTHARTHTHTHTMGRHSHHHNGVLCMSSCLVTPLFLPVSPITW